MLSPIIHIIFTKEVPVTILQSYISVSKIDTIPSLCAKLFEITQLDEQHWITSIKKKKKKLKAWQFRC